MAAKDLQDFLCHRLEKNQPKIITCSSLLSSYSLNLEEIESILRKICASCQDEEEVNRYRLVYSVIGFMTLSTTADIKVRTRFIVNEDDVTDDLQTKLYGIYRGGKLSPVKLSVDRLVDVVASSRSIITLPTSHTPDGNCERDIVGRPIKTEGGNNLSNQQSLPSSQITQNKPSSSGPSSAAATQKKSSATMSAVAASFFKSDNKTQMIKKKQPTLNFGAAKPNQKQEETTTEEEEKPSHKRTSGTTENGEQKKSPAEEKKRSRIQVFSSDSESGEENRERISIKKSDSAQINPAASSNAADRKKSDKKAAESSTKEAAKVVNRTGLKLDMDDLQNESDEEMDTQDKTNEAEEEKSKKRKRRRKTSEEAVAEGAEDTSSQTKRSKKNTHNFGTAKAGGVCSSVKEVDKTYLDSEGFLVTEKVLEEVPASEMNQVEPPKQKQQVKKPLAPPANKKAANSRPKQQSSLLTFFHKK